MNGHGRAPNADKGARYVALLDQALCNARWSEVAELTRKVDKHAPDRNCLTLAARAQLQISTASHRPTSASSATSTSIHGLGELLPRLVEAIPTAAKTQPDDAFLASTSLAEIHWLREAPIDALKTLDAALAPTVGTAGSASPLGWLEVCEVKGSFIRASCLDTCGRQSEAREAYQAAVSRTPGYRTPELRTWTERLLAHACMYCVKKMPSPSLHDFTETYVAFHAWGELWLRTPTPAGNAATTTRWDVPRRQVWKAYYELMSALLQHRLLRVPHTAAGISIVPSNDIPPNQHSIARQLQRAEIKRVEATYETFILAETKFPKASQANTEIEAWVEQVMTNWRMFADSDWTDADLGVGGKRTVSRDVLGILYRAATKSFHSTPILRHLCTVHAALVEFDLAMHAFDSYVEIVDQGKSRAGRMAKHEVGFDNDDTAMLTAVEAVRILCRYGDRDQAVKAIGVGETIQKWLERGGADTTLNGESNGDQRLPPGPAYASIFKPETLGAAYRAIGISQAHWAQLTYESEMRSSLLAEAQRNLQRAHTFDKESLETTHALALVLAQTRHVSASLNLIRATIESTESSSIANGGASLSGFELQRRLIPLWHLLALCLTSEDQFEAASHVCAAAYRQLGDSQVLFGPDPAVSNPEKATVDSSTTSSILDRMESFEKESMIQIKITQIMLFELMEGSEDATDLTDELFGLYSRLFGSPEDVAADVTSKPPPTAASHAPSKLGGTLRSIAGSIRPRSARSTVSSEKEIRTQRSVVSEGRSVAPASPPATNGQLLEQPISITVTNEDGVASEKPQHHHHLPRLPFHDLGRHSNSTRPRSPARSAVRVNDLDSEKALPASANFAAGSSGRPDQPLGNVVHNASHNELPAPLGHDDQPPRQDIRLPAPHPASSSAVPEPQMSPLFERRHKASVLVKVLLFTAGLYIRAETYDDAENLIHDAARLIQSLELQISGTESGLNTQRLFNKGWGSGKSVDELWGNLWSTKAKLALARDHPFEAMRAYEQTLAHEPDSPGGIVGLSNMLMDIYEEKMPAEEPIVTLQPLPTASHSLIAEAKPTLTRPNTSSTLPSRRQSAVVETRPVDLKEQKSDPSPAELNRLAARDRAYMLLSNLTKQGSGWDDSEAWYTLARAHELSREIEKAKQALWWVVELENNTPIRPWNEVSPGGYTL